jgi:hypothetical protein
LDACGAEIPRWIRLRLQSYGDDSASIKAFGLDVVTRLCEQLRAGGVPGLHFYTHLRREIGDIACPGMHPVPETKSPFDGVFCSSAKAAGLTKLVPTMPRRP